MARPARLRRGPPRSIGRTATESFVFILVLAIVLAGLKFSGLLSIDEGPVRVIDGDSLWRGEAEIRLSGIDAPEYRQTCKDKSGQDWACGQNAARALKQLIGGRDVACEIRDTDRFERLVAVCKAGEVDLNQEMVRQGWAISFGTLGVGYASAEAQARNDRRGIWRGNFERPQDWRRRHQAIRGTMSGRAAPED
jgi:endonuclease YncB( thermonuclease family)